MIVNRVYDGDFFPVRFDELPSNSGDRYSRSWMIVLSRGSPAQQQRSNECVPIVRHWNLRKPTHMIVNARDQNFTHGFTSQLALINYSKNMLS
jgi:hypothetical protein